MEIQALNPGLAQAWEKFCLESDDAWFWHTLGWLEYCENYRPGSENHSFLVLDARRILGICPIFLEKWEWGGRVVQEFSASGYPIPWPGLANDLTPNERERVLECIFDFVDTQASEKGALKSSFRVSSLAPASLASKSRYNHLLRYGYLDTSLNTQIIDLCKSEEELHQGIRRRYKGQINRGMRKLELYEVDQDNYSDELFEGYRLLHGKAHGVTRPIRTFELMSQWIREGYGALIGARADEGWVGFIYLFLYKGGAYYGSGCNDYARDERLSISHVLQWRAILYLKRHGFRNYEIGWQQFGPQLHSVPTQKEMAIAFFKRGFGGSTVPMFAGEKYYSKDVFLQVYSDRVRRCAEAIEEHHG